MRAQARTGLVNRMPALMASCALLIFSVAAAAQTAADPDALNDVLRTLQAPASLEPPVVHKNDDGFIRFLGAPPAGRFLTPLSGQKAAGDPVESAKSFIDGHGAAFGVQSNRNRQRDFSRGKPSHFILLGLLFTLLFVLLLFGVVRLVLNLAGVG